MFVNMLNLTFDVIINSRYIVSNIFYLTFDIIINFSYLFFTYLFLLKTMTFMFDYFVAIHKINYGSDYVSETDSDTETETDNDNDTQDIQKSLNIKEPPKPPFKINYEDKYLEKFKKIENKYLNVENLKSLKNSFVFETTPAGRVIMCYNYDADPDLCAFYYYSNTIVPYKLLDIVAQKYVITFDCKILYLDISAELDNLKKKVIANHKKLNDEFNGEKAKELTQHNKLFASFKKYNTTSSTIQIKEDNSKLVIKEKINKYINKGKITNFEFIKKVDKKLVSKNYSLKFSDFKKLNL